ncbi:MAG: ankyrin repeat domain-containing protein [Treponema sp.]|nr:ankyrin repeat domain-containing protein [Treponema sp.]
MNKMKRNFLRVSLFFLSFFAFCSRWSDRAFETVENGTVKEIRKAVETDYSFIKYKREGKQNLLMAALEADRENAVVKSLLRAGISPKAKDKNGKTALMYASENESDIEAINTVLKYNAPFKFQRKKRILQKDKNGKNALDYAKENSKQSEIEALFSKYVPIPSLETENETEIAPNADENAENLEEAEILSELPAEPILPAESAGAFSPVAAAVVPAVAETVPAIEEKKVSEIDEKNKIEEIQEKYPKEKEIAAIQNEKKSAKPKENSLIELDKMIAPVSETESIYLYDYAENIAKDNLIPEELLKSSEVTFIENADKNVGRDKTKLTKATKTALGYAEKNKI